VIQESSKAYKNIAANITAGETTNNQRLSRTIIHTK